MITLGINSVYHESAAALVIDGQVVAATEEERFNRRKHAKSAEPHTPHILPLKAIAFCLNRANLTPQELDKIAFSFEPSVLLEKVKDWFEIGRPSESLKYMLFTCPVRPEKQDKIPAVVHVDGTSRIQLVDRKTNSKYYRLIEQFEKNTGVPLVLNTSFRID